MGNKAYNLELLKLARTRRASLIQDRSTLTELAKTVTSAQGYALHTAIGQMTLAINAESDAIRDIQQRLWRVHGVQAAQGVAA